jgi:hypothetical protein
MAEAPFLGHAPAFEQFALAGLRLRAQVRYLLLLGGGDGSAVLATGIGSSKPCL